MSEPCQVQQALQLQASDDYRSLPAETIAELAERAARIQTALQRSLVEIGYELTQAKKLLTHGQFTDWVESETGLTIRTAQLIMRAYELCRRNENFSLLSKSALYLLGADGVAEAAISVVRERIAAGNVPRYVEVREIVQRAATDRTEANATTKERPASRPPTTASQIAKAEAQKARAEAEARIWAGVETIPSEPRERLIQALRMLASESAAERAEAAAAVERERARLGMTWDELIVPAEVAETELRQAA